MPNCWSCCRPKSPQTPPELRERQGLHDDTIAFEDIVSDYPLFRKTFSASDWNIITDKLVPEDKFLPIQNLSCIYHVPNRSKVMKDLVPLSGYIHSQPLSPERNGGSLAEEDCYIRLQLRYSATAGDRPPQDPRALAIGHVWQTFSPQQHHSLWSLATRSPPQAPVTKT